MVRITPQLHNDLKSLLAGGDPAVIAERVGAMPADQIAAIVAQLHPADGADVLEGLQPSQQSAVLSTMERVNAAEVMAFLDSETQGAVAAEIPQDKLVPILEEMEPADAADVLAEMPAGVAEATLNRMEGAEQVEALLKYEEETAGRLMSPHGVTLREGASVGQTLALLRRLHPSEELAYYLYVADGDGKLRGVVSLRQLVTADPQTKIGDIMSRQVISVPAAADREEAARVLSHYGLLALPTVDEAGRLVGVITADDVINVIQEEATEDLYHLAGLHGEERVDQSLWMTAGRRLQWLVVNLPTALLAAAVVNRFEGTLQKVTALAAFMPVVAGMGGNAGIQTLTLIVRSIALGQLSLRDSWGALGRELLVGLVNGLCFGLVLALLGWLWKGMPYLGLVVGISMMVNMLAAALAGTLVPLLLKRLGADPALASGVIVTTFTDVVGYGCFLGSATLLLSRLL